MTRDLRPSLFCCLITKSVSCVSGDLFTKLKARFRLSIEVLPESVWATSVTCVMLPTPCASPRSQVAPLRPHFLPSRGNALRPAHTHVHSVCHTSKSSLLLTTMIAAGKKEKRSYSLAFNFVLVFEDLIHII